MSSDWIKQMARELYQAHVDARPPEWGKGSPPTWDQLMPGTQLQWRAAAVKAVELVTEHMAEEKHDVQ